MKKDASTTIKRAERFQIILIGEGLLVGLIAGVVILAYRLLLEKAAHWLNLILNYIGNNPYIPDRGWL